MTQALTHQHLSPDAIRLLVADLPDYIKAALLAKSTELDCSLAEIIELAIASFLDEEALSFEDCLLAQRLKQASDESTKEGSSTA